MAEEKLFENKVKDYLRSEGAWFVKYWAGTRFTKEGIPDILACYKGRFVAIETKASNGAPTLLQLVNLKKIRKAYGIGVLLYPNDFNAFKSFLNGVKSDWYKENIELQQKWFERLNKASH